MAIAVEKVKTDKEDVSLIVLMSVLKRKLKSRK